MKKRFVAKGRGVNGQDQIEVEVDDDNKYVQFSGLGFYQFTCAKLTRHRARQLAHFVLEVTDD